MTTASPKVGADILERAVSTYVQTFAGRLAAANIGFDEVSDLSVVKTAAIAALPAALSIIKGAFASAGPFGDRSASLARVGYERIKRVVVEVPVEVPAKKKAPAKKTVAAKAPAKKK